MGLAVSSSFLLAMTVVPALAAFATRREAASPPGQARWWRDGFTHPLLSGLYRQSLRLVLRRPALGIAVSLLLPVLPSFAYDFL